jgi:hypothetical protein
MKFHRTVLSVSIATAMATLSACGGGGGGGGNSTQTYINRQVPFHTPTRVSTITPLATTSDHYDNSAIFSADLNSDSKQEVIIAGRMSPNGGSVYYDYNLSVFGWSNGQLVDQTQQWFANASNRIVGTEPSVKFADFNGDGRQDIYLAPHTDTNVYGPGVVLFNNGNSFSRTNIDFSNPGNIHAHDSAVYDMNNDGYSDILTLSYRSDSRISFGSAAGTFTTYDNKSSVGKGTGVAVADFMGDGTSTIIMTEGTGGGTRLYSWAITSQLGSPNLYFNEISVLPTPRFLLPKWASYGFDGSHDVRVLAFDFDHSNRTSAVVISRAGQYLSNGQWPKYSEVQFLKNQGGGVFIDVTDSVLVGYNHNTDASYNPALVDVNSDGLIDIVLSAPNWDNNSGSQVLIHTADHKFVSSYATVLKAFQDQSLDIERSINAATAGPGANGIVFVQGPDNQMYIATAVTFSNNGIQQKAIYLSKLGSMNPTAQATANTIRQQWPWMSDAQVNAVLAQSSTTWFGLNVLDPSKALSPIGALSLPVNGRLMNLGGYIGGINLNGAANSINVVDSIGRNFTMNYSSTNTPGIVNIWGRFVENIDDDTRGAQVSGVQTFRYNGFKFGGTEDNRNMVVGLTGIDIAKDTSLSVQYTRMPFSPFVQLNGSWGLVKSSSTMESTITNRQGGFVSKLGLMYSSTEIESGLVNRVNPISSVWAESGYEWKHFRAYAGMLPKVVSGSADITLPTGIDNRGQIQYTNTRADVYGPAVQYARFNYADRINRYANYRINAMVTTQKYHAVMGEIRINF